MANARDHATSKQDDRGLTDKIAEARSQAGEAVHQVGRQARKAATSLASDANEKVVGLMDRQVGAGADLAGHIASSVRSAADDLEKNAPQLAGFVRDAAQSIDRLSGRIRDQSAGDLFRASSAFARRRPAVIFGGAAILGFLLYRVVNAPIDASGRDGGGANDDFDEGMSPVRSSGGGGSASRPRKSSTTSQSQGD